ncbi:MAG TPA: type II toxin-antitoxin system ParD family antitoxin [Tepidisphaeraceae bacterium]|nr:type II toxin-antitoxin system ParD family antitoxin [Tepidisphaeraceae bacterium]
MGRRTTLNISLTTELQDLVDEKIASGRYGSASEVVGDGLKLIEQRDRKLAIDEMRARIDVGWQQSERGEGDDGEAVFAEMRKRLVEKLPPKKPAKRSKRKRA